MTIDEAKKLLLPYLHLRESGETLIGLCPFHKEVTPSFTVHPTLEHYHCFGCGKGGLLDGLVWELNKLREEKNNRDTK